jgi:WXG100 family type VII secretion target
MDITLKVQPDVLIAKAGDLSREKTTITGLMNQAKDEITSLRDAWKSPAADEYQGRFNQIYDDIDNMFAIIAEHISDLNEAANIYTTAEKSAKTVAEGLPTDGVFRV